MKTQTLQRTPSEPITFVSGYRERGQAMAQINDFVQKILHPRATTSFGGVAHFLPVPRPPLAKINRLGKAIEVDEAEEKRFQEELEAVGERERDLRSLAQDARNVMSELDRWNAALSADEEPFETTSRAGALIDADLADLDACRRDHERFLRVCQCWIDRLAY